MNDIIASGEFNENSKGQLVKNEFLPKKAIVTAVIGIIENEKGEIFLAKNDRGWDLPGGHVEKNESIKETLHREVKEEAGTDIEEKVNLWGYRKITNTTAQFRKDGTQYPDNSYIAYYKGKSSGEAFNPYGKEIIEAKTLNVNEAIKITQNDVDKIILEDIYKK